MSFILESTRKILHRQHYGLVGKHSAVQICRWTKKSLLDRDFCYKQQFYGIESHRCCQMSPAVMWCQNRCLHCWRAIELTAGLRIEEKEADKPAEVIKGCIEAQRKLLSGFKGNPLINEKKLYESFEPAHFAISLAGEPTIYPFIGELIKELRQQKKTTFLVTNGLLPEKLKELIKQDSLPTQLYLSLNAPTKQLYKKFARPTIKNAWEKFNRTIKLFPQLDTRKIIRLTLVRNLNMSSRLVGSFAKLIKKASPDFIEVKAFMSVGFARQRLGYERMPLHSEIQRFAKKLSIPTKMPILDEKAESRVVLLGKDASKMQIKNI